MAKEIRPDTQHEEYTENAAKWQRARDTFAGTDAVKSRREQYLPKLDVHLRGTRADERYNSYLRRAYFFNAVKRSVIGLAGLIHQTAPTVKAPEDAEAWLQDVTLTGISAQLQALLTTQETILVGRSGILVEMTSDLRPYWITVKAENIFNWRVKYDGGQPYLSMVVLRECVYKADPEDPFKTDEEERFRCLTLVEGVYTQTIWEKDKSGKWASGEVTTPLRRGSPLDFIPFIFVGPTSSDPCVEAPPVIDLVDLNISHYQTTANLEHGLGFLGSPSLVLIGAASVGKDGKPIEYGSSSALTLPAGGDAKILQADGNMMGALERAEERKRNLLSVMGARLLEAPPGTQETATAVSMRHSGEHATLKTIAQSVERAFTWVLKVSLWWGGTGAEVEDVDANFELNKDFFSTTLGPEDIKALLASLQAGAISFETFWHEFIEGGHGRPGVTAEEEQKQIDSEGGSAKMPGAPPPPGTPGAPVVVGNPYEVKQLAGKWVVTKKGTDDVVPGGEHGTDKAKAMKHFAALEMAYHKEQK